MLHASCVIFVILNEYMHCSKERIISQYECDDRLYFKSDSYLALVLDPAIRSRLRPFKFLNTRASYARFIVQKLYLKLMGMIYRHAPQKNRYDTRNISSLNDLAVRCEHSTLKKNSMIGTQKETTPATCRNCRIFGIF